VREAEESIHRVAEDVGMDSGTLAKWVVNDEIARGERLVPRHLDPERLRKLAS
jgi:hypothetical protein